MRRIVNIVFVNQDNAFSPMRENIVKTLEFDIEDEAYEFEKNFASKFIFDGTQSRYVAEVAPIPSGASAELLFTVSIAYGEYILGRELATDIQIAENLAMARACTDPSSAFAMNKHGQLVELEGNNVGTLTFYTLNHNLAEELNQGQ